jgi:hypothetical protein
MRLSTETITALRAAGLHIGDEPFFVKDHVAYPSGYLVIKPTKAGGYGVPGWSSSFGSAGETTNAPAVNVWPAGGAWRWEVREMVPGPGPGDFSRRAADEATLVAGILNYYFGQDPKMAELLWYASRR